MADLSIDMIRELQRVAELYREREGERRQRSVQDDFEAAAVARRASLRRAPARLQG